MGKKTKQPREQGVVYAVISAKGPTLEFEIRTRAFGVGSYLNVELVDHYTGIANEVDARAYAEAFRAAADIVERNAGVWLKTAGPTPAAPKPRNPSQKPPAKPDPKSRTPVWHEGSKPRSRGKKAGSKANAT
jgi:hypothetical protein